MAEIEKDFNKLMQDPNWVFALDRAQIREDGKSILFKVRDIAGVSEMGWEHLTKAFSIKDGIDGQAWSLSPVPRNDGIYIQVTSKVAFSENANQKSFAIDTARRLTGQPVIKERPITPAQQAEASIIVRPPTFDTTVFSNKENGGQTR